MKSEMTDPMKLVKKRVLVFGVFGHALIVAQNITVGDTVWYVVHMNVADVGRCPSLTLTLCSVEGFVMDALCIQLGTLLDNPEVVTLEGPGNHTFHWYVNASTWFLHRESLASLTVISISPACWMWKSALTVDTTFSVSLKMAGCTLSPIGWTRPGEIYWLNSVDPTVRWETSQRVPLVQAHKTMLCYEVFEPR
jgi:hypothetical protein